MSRLIRVVALLLLVLPAVIGFFWTPITPDQKLPLLELESPEILPDPDGESPATVGNNSSALEGNMGYATPFVHEGRQPWPRSGIIKRRRRVRFCYATAQMKEKLECRLKEALELWKESLGGEASEETGHSLAFSEVTDRDEPQLCYKDFDVGTWRGKRNSRVSHNVLHVFWQDAENSKGLSEASLGYRDYDYPGMKAARNWLIIADPPLANTIAHELGHVLGMLHEMQRSDRDNYLEFRCTKLKGFDEALRKAKADNGKLTDDEATKKLCEVPEFALEYNFPAFAYAKLDNIAGEGELDTRSIMMYESEAFANQKCFDNLDECPLVKIKKENGVKVGTERIIRAEKPSPGDAAFVKKYYPW